MGAPETRYTRSGDVNIAYQVIGEGPLDLVYVMGWVTNLEAFWQEPSVARFFQRLASFSRLILFDKRGTGLSDRVPISELPTLEQRMDDVRAVMDAAGSERAALFGVSEGGPMCALFAATYPERTSALVLYGSYAKRLRDPDYPWAPTLGERQRWYELIERGWGGLVDIDTMAPNADRPFREWWARYLRMSASPGAALALGRMNAEIDIRGVLPSIRVPTLIMHRTGDRDMDVGGARYMTGMIAGSRYVELPGDDHLPFVGDQDAILDEIEEFLTGARHHADLDRILATVLFTDVVGSTERAAALGDKRWRDLLESYNQVIREELERFRGREVDTAGDGFFATFDGPARAIRCACAMRSKLARLGIEIRAGLHTGECELVGDKVRGISVHIGSRVASLATPGEVLVSSTVKDLVAGSGLEFEDRGVHTLRGVPGEWRLFSVVA
jgi:class 3 adenylate cyclase/pimeloyl-ACP methyl ester carboxylesterase